MTAALLALSSFTFAAGIGATADDTPADLILITGRIWTGDADQPWAEAVAARDGVIVAVGNAEDVKRLRSPQTRVIDVPTGFATPGLIDAHGHLTSLGATVDELDLRGARSPEGIARRVAERAQREPGDAWIVGRNWDQSLWPDMQFPTAQMLDQAAPNRPVWLTRVDGHAGWANSEALRRTGVDRDTTTSAGGQIIRDNAGTPTGVFIDAAMGVVTSKIPAPTRDEVQRRILAAQTLCLANGLTGVHDAGVGRQEAALFRELDEQSRLKLRVYGMARAGKDPFAIVSEPPQPARPGGWFAMRAIKLYADGAMGSRGAALFQPYADDPDNRGLLLIDPELLGRVTETALKNGWQVCTHAIGDRGNALVLDAYEQALHAVPDAKDARLRVEHAQVVRREDVARFRQLGLIASMQPSHASTDKRWADLRLGAASDRVRGAYAWRWFFEERVPVACGSDFPVEVPSPFWGLYAAVTRQDERGEPPGGWHPEQSMTLDEALAGFTRGAAYASFAEGHVGTLKVGMRADITVIDRDLFRSTPSELLRTTVTYTIIDGEVVFENGATP